METAGKFRLTLKLDPDSWHGNEGEGVWVAPIGRTGRGAVVEIDNIPFFSRSVSLGDVVTVELVDNEMVMSGVVERGGHSTYRIFIEKPSSRATTQLEQLKSKGCDWERTRFLQGDLYAVDVPPEADIYEIYRLLEEGLVQELWLFEEGFVGHPEDVDIKKN